MSSRSRISKLFSPLAVGAALMAIPLFALAAQAQDKKKSIVDFPSIKRVPGGASNDQTANLQNPGNPVPALDLTKPSHIKGGMED